MCVCVCVGMWAHGLRNGACKGWERMSQTNKHTHDHHDKIQQVRHLIKALTRGVGSVGPIMRRKQELSLGKYFVETFRQNKKKQLTNKKKNQTTEERIGGKVIKK